MTASTHHFLCYCIQQCRAVQYSCTIEWGAGFVTSYSLLCHATTSLSPPLSSLLSLPILFVLFPYFLLFSSCLSVSLGSSPEHCRMLESVCLIDNELIYLCSNPVSQCPKVPVSQFPIILLFQVSQCHTVSVSQCLSVPVSQCPCVPTRTLSSSLAEPHH